MFGVAAKIMNSAGDLMSPHTQSFANPRIDELVEQLALSILVVVSLTTRMSDLEDLRDKAQQNYDALRKKIGQKVRTVENYIVAKGDSALSLLWCFAVHSRYG